MSGNTFANTWDVSPEDARTLQDKLRKSVKIEPLGQKPNLIAGADISFNKYESTVYAGFALLEMGSLKLVAHALAVTEVRFPYIPGLLFFREIPALLDAWHLMPTKPDLVMVDGHGIAHPRRMGIATHFGLATGIPTIGVAKKKLVGTYEEPRETAGSYTLLQYQQETLAYVYRSKQKVKPVFVSPGHKTNLEDALQLIRQSCGRYRLPEPTRQAHLLVNQLRRGEIKAGYNQYGG